MFCRRHVRAAAKVQPFALTIDLDRFRFRQILDDLGLVILTLVLEIPDGLIPRPHLPRERACAFHDLAHLRLDGRKIVGGERFIAREIVEEPVFDVRADRHLRPGEKFLDCFSQNVGAVMADQLQRRVVLALHNRNAGIFCHGK